MPLDRVDVDHAQRCERLEDLDWVPDLDRAELEAVARCVTPMRADAGTTLLRQGAVEAWMAILVRGEVDVLRRTPDGEDKLIASAGPGRTFGEMSLIDGGPRSATVEAATPIEVFVMTRRQLDELCAASPTAANKVILRMARAMSMRLRQTSSILSEIIDGDG